MIKVIRATADWCGPCKMYAPIFDKIQENESFSEVEFEVLDVDSNPNKAQELGIRSIPTTFFMKDDEVISRKTGVLREEEIGQEIQKIS